MKFSNYLFTKNHLDRITQFILKKPVLYDLNINLSEGKFFETKLCTHIHNEFKKSFGAYNETTIRSIFEEIQIELEDVGCFDNIRFDNNYLKFEPS